MVISSYIIVKLSTGPVLSEIEPSSSLKLVAAGSLSAVATLPMIPTVVLAGSTNESATGCAVPPGPPWNASIVTLSRRPVAGLSGSLESMSLISVDSPTTVMGLVVPA